MWTLSGMTFRYLQEMAHIIILILSHKSTAEKFLLMGKTLHCSVTETDFMLLMKNVLI